MNTNGKKTWGFYEDIKLSKLIKEGKKPREIAGIMGFAATTIYEKAVNLKRRSLTNPKRKERLCLGGCKKMFMSTGPGNRICIKCSKLDRSGVIDPVAITSMGIN